MLARRKEIIGKYDAALKPLGVETLDHYNSLNIDFYQAANWQDADPSQIAIDEKAYDIKIKSVPISRNPLARTNWTALEMYLTV